MIISLRSLIAVSAIAVFSAAVTPSAKAGINLDHSTTWKTSLEKTGFLGFKSFLIGPSGRDEPGIAMEGMRIISPATLFPAAPGYRRQFLPPELFMPLKPLRAPAPVAHDMDSLKIDIKGVPMMFSLGLKEALQRDLNDHISYYGVSGLTNPATGFASAAYLQSATQDIMKKIDRLERMNGDRAGLRTDTLLPRRTMTLQEPPSILIFLTGLLFIVLLRGKRLQTRESF